MWDSGKHNISYKKQDFRATCTQELGFTKIEAGDVLFFLPVSWVFGGKSYFVPLSRNMQINQLHIISFQTKVESVPCLL